MNVLHLRTSVGGNAYGLSRAERELGFNSDVLVAGSNPLRYPADISVNYSQDASSLAQFLRSLTLLKAFLSVRSKYDVFHFNFGSSLIHLPRKGLPLLDVPFYPRRAKRIFTFNGCDARQKYSTMQRCQTSACHHSDCYGGICCDIKVDKSRKDCILKVDKYADAIFALNPDLLYFLPERAQFLPYTIASWNEISPTPWTNIHPPLRLAHAPTNRVAKGSDAVFAAVDSLQKEYGKDRIVLDCIENIPHAEAIARYSKCHLVVDQLRVGWYGALAVEAMRLGKPTLVYLREEDFHFLPAGMANDCRSAFVHAHEGNLVDVLRPFVEDISLLQPIREAAIEYVHKWHDPLKVARIVTEKYIN